MLEINMKRKDLAALLNTGESKISGYLKGESEITFKHARILHQKLNIDGDIILQ